MNNADKPVYPTKGATYKTSGDPNRIDLDYPEHSVFKFGGLTKREYFAAMALSGMAHGYSDPKQAAEQSIRYADEILRLLDNDKS